MFSYINDLFINMIQGPSYPITTIINLVCCLFMIADNDRVKKPVILADLAVMMTAYILMASVLYIIPGTNTLHNNIIVFFICIIIYDFFISKKKLPTKIMDGSIFLSSMYIYIEISMCAGKLTDGTNQLLNMVAVNGPVVFITLCNIIVSRISFKEIDNKVPLSNSIVVLIISIICILSNFLFTLDYDTLARYVIFINASLYFTELAIYVITSKLVAAQSENIDLIAETTILDNTIKVMKLSEENELKLREMRHDIKNQFSVISSLLDLKKYDEAKKMLEEFSAYGGVVKEDKFRKENNVFDCGNVIINAIMNNEFRKAGAENVAIKADIVVPSILNFNSNSICGVLSNLVDNAIEATAACGEDERQPVEVMMKVVHDVLFIRVTNRYSRDISSEKVLSLKTTKKDPLAHGYGSKIVKRIIEDNGGAVKYSTAEGNIFVADAMMQPSEEKGGKK